MKRIFFLSLIFILFLKHNSFAQESQASINVNPEVAKLVKLKASLIKENKLAERYTIQIGSFTSLDSAKKMQRKFDNEYSGVNSQVTWESPNYKVWVGHFPSRLEAERLFIVLKKDYKSAFVFKPNS